MESAQRRWDHHAYRVESIDRGLSRDRRRDRGPGFLAPLQAGVDLIGRRARHVIFPASLGAP
ncbi:hypothetical protein [Streptosporangium minutum]|uniref:Uncharacterized protein n=1 Tax=Streptosporangium minutum TaxID=569862 RepID=A0A243RLJ8_9ACTN|nr:hypothetical protein [Streptosporangium minutum]OUC95771.1 hypothetical protein CA984_17490 [Streptosporangium minutum]